MQCENVSKNSMFIPSTNTAPVYSSAWGANMRSPSFQNIQFPIGCPFLFSLIHIHVYNILRSTFCFWYRIIQGQLKFLTSISFSNFNSFSHIYVDHIIFILFYFNCFFLVFFLNFFYYFCFPVGLFLFFVGFYFISIWLLFLFV